MNSQRIQRFHRIKISVRNSTLVSDEEKNKTFVSKVDRKSKRFNQSEIPAR